MASPFRPANRGLHRTLSVTLGYNNEATCGVKKKFNKSKKKILKLTYT